MAPWPGPFIRLRSEAPYRRREAGSRRGAREACSSTPHRLDDGERLPQQPIRRCSRWSLMKGPDLRGRCAGEARQAGDAAGSGQRR